MSGTSRGGFTFVEVLAILLVVVLGLLGVVGLVSYAMLKAGHVQAGATGMATAESVALDPTPLLAAATAGDWSYTPYDMNDATASRVLTSQAKGYVNGYYVVRNERSDNGPDPAAPLDIIAKGANGTVYVRSALVEVDVFEALGGRRAASYTTRILRQRGTP